MSYWDSTWGFVKQNPKTGGGMIFLMVLTIALALTLSLVWSDYIFGWGLLRKKYPGEACTVEPDGTNNCLDGLGCCPDGRCACSCAAAPAGGAP